MRNIFISSSDNTLVHTPSLTPEECRQWFIKATGKTPDDVVEIRDDEIQFYIIDGRVFNTENDDRRVRKLIAS